MTSRLAVLVVGAVLVASAALLPGEASAFTIYHLGLTFPVSDGPTSITLRGVVAVSPGGGTNPTAQFDYADTAGANNAWCTSQGANGSPDQSTTAQPLSVATTNHVQPLASGLTEGHTYCYRLFVTDDSHPTVTQWGRNFTAGEPNVITDDLQSTGAQSATLDGEVDPVGRSDVSYYIGYALNSDTFCTTNGQSGSPTTTTPVALGAPPPDSGYLPVSADLTGLMTGTTYCAALVAQSTADGTAYSEPTAFRAGQPRVDTFGTTNIDTGKTQVAGQVNPIGQSVSYYVNYAPIGDPYCADGTSAHSSTAPQSDLPADSGYHQVSVEVDGLTAGNQYCAQLAVMTSFETQGGGVVWKAGTPSAHPGNTTSNSSTSEHFTGIVSSANQATSFSFQYALSSSDWCGSEGQTGTPTTLPAQQLDASTTPANAIDDASGLTPSTFYCWGITATNGTGTVFVFGDYFSTSGGGGGQPAPTATTGAASGVGDTGATLNGSVNPNGASTSYHFEYGTTTSYGSSTGSSDAGAGNGSVPASATIGGLTAGTTYHYRLVAINSGGTTFGDDATLTTTSPQTGGGSTPPGGSTQPPGGSTLLPVVPGTLPPDGTVFAAGTQPSPGLDTVTGSVSITEPGSSFAGELIFNGNLAKITVIGKLTKKGLPKGMFQFKIKVAKKYAKALKKKKTLKVILKTTVTPPGGKPIVKTKHILMKRGKSSGCAATVAHAAC